MNKIEALTVTFSIVITTVFSCLISFAGASLYGSFWSWFAISFLLQVIGFVIWNSYLIQKDNALAFQAEFDSLKMNPVIVTKMSCAYCSQANETQIQLNKKNTFKCVSCNQVNGIVIQLTSTTLTTPVESVKLPVNQTETAEIKFAT